MKNEIEAVIMVVFSTFLLMGSVFIGIGLSSGDIFFTLGGIFFAGVGSVAIISIMYRRHIQKQLKNTGVAIYTDLVDVILEHTRVNDIQAYRVRTQWLDSTTNTLYYFQSNYIKDDPTEKLDNITKIKVLVNPRKYSQYYMDLPF